LTLAEFFRKSEEDKLFCAQDKHLVLQCFAIAMLLRQSCIRQWLIAMGPPFGPGPGPDDRMTSIDWMLRPRSRQLPMLRQSCILQWLLAATDFGETQQIHPGHQHNWSGSPCLRMRPIEGVLGKLEPMISVGRQNVPIPVLQVCFCADSWLMKEELTAIDISVLSYAKGNYVSPMGVCLNRDYYWYEISATPHALYDPEEEARNVAGWLFCIWKRPCPMPQRASLSIRRSFQEHDEKMRAALRLKRIKRDRVRELRKKSAKREKIRRRELAFSKKYISYL